MLRFPVYFRKPVSIGSARIFGSPDFSFAPTTENLSLLFSSSPGLFFTLSEFCEWSHDLSLCISVASELFSDFSLPKFPATCLKSVDCALLQKQRRGWGSSRFQGLVRTRSSAAASVTPLESVFTPSADASPLECAFTKTPGWVYPCLQLA
jgi:hypothetical protein